MHVYGGKDTRNNPHTHTQKKKQMFKNLYHIHPTYQTTEAVAERCTFSEKKGARKNDYAYIDRQAKTLLIERERRTGGKAVRKEKEKKRRKKTRKTFA